MWNIILIGAGGTGMSGIAMLLYDLWYRNLIAIDAMESTLMLNIDAKWIKTIIWHGKYIIQRDDIVVYSDISSIISWPELKTSYNYQQTPIQDNDHICLSYNQLIAEISKYFLTIAVAGSNGKTSTTGVLIYTLLKKWEINNKDEITSINIDLESINANQWTTKVHASQTFGIWIVWWLMLNYSQQWYAINNSVCLDLKSIFDNIFDKKSNIDISLFKKYIFVIEACEYKDHFLLYDVDYSLVTNIDRDHTDYFTTYHDYCESFFKFICNTKQCTILTNSSYASIQSRCEKKSVDIKNIWLELKIKEKIIISQDYFLENPKLIGKYHWSNAGMIDKLLQTLWKSEYKKIWNYLNCWEWIERRMEFIGNNKKWAPIYSDYSHHAPAILGNVDTIQIQFPNKKIIAIFQPHQAQRVLAWRNDFKLSLAWANHIVIYTLYTARENFDTMKKDNIELKNLNSFDDLGEKFANHIWWQYTNNIDKLIVFIQECNSDSIIVYFSAGDLDQKIKKIIQKLD